MIKKRLLILAPVILFCLFFCACDLNGDDSVKALTKPYINEYVCTRATLDGDDFLKKFEYIKITFLDDEELEISFKREGGERRAYKCGYTFDESTRELTAELGILGAEVKNKTVIEGGRFTVVKTFCNKTLIMVFEVK